MKQPHLYKAASRLGIRTFPNGMKELNLGVEDAPEAILTSDFLKKFPESLLSSYSFPTPDNLTPEAYEALLVKNIQEFSNLLFDTLKDDEMQVVIGGDHIISLPSVLAVIRRAKKPEDVGYIHLDSHGDMNRFTTSPTGNFHGIYLRPLTGSCGIREIDALVPEKLSSKNLIMIGNLDLDPEEQNYIEYSGIQTFNLQQLRENTESVQSTIEDFTKQFPYLHVSLDIDVLDHSIAPATGIPATHGFLMEDIKPLMNIFAAHPNLSFDISEVNPKKNGGDTTVRTAQSILLEVLRSKS